MANKKFELTGNTKIWRGRTLYQIKALISFGIVSAGELGGHVEKETNVSEDGDAWVSGNAQVYGDARVSGDARVYGDAWVYGDAQVSGNAQVYVGKHTITPAMAVRSDGYTFVAYTTTELRIVAGCRNFSWDEAIAHWNAGHRHHSESVRIINFLREQVEAREPVKTEAAA